MRVEELRDSVSKIHMEDEMRREIIANVKERTGEHAAKTEDGTAHITGSGRASGWRKAVAAAAMLAAVSGVLALPVRAIVDSLVQERLEEMSEEEIGAVYETAVNSEEEADSFSREYTDSEKERYRTLAQKYKDGTFPEKEIPQVDREEETGQNELCFIVPRSTFHLPERELTDEEILEIIDFNVKRDYALRQNYENQNAQEIARQEEEDKQKIADNVESGGITQQQAIEIATDSLDTFFAGSGEGMERNSYYNEKGLTEAGEASYAVTWMDPVTHKSYYIELGARDGRVLRAAQTDPEAVELSDLAMEEAEEKIGILYGEAEAFLQKLGISYANGYVYYLESANGIVYRDGVRFVFEIPDQPACGVTYSWDGMMKNYAEVDLMDYLECDGQPRTMHIRGEEVQMQQVFRKLQDM